MKLKFFTILTLFLFMQNAYCQLEKGNWMIDGNANFNLAGSNELFNEGSVLAGFSIGLGKMVTSKVMVGTGISIGSGNFLTFQNNEPFSTQLYNYALSPFMRYYLNPPSKFRPFVFLDNELRRQIFEQKEGIDETNLKNRTHFSSFLGIGADYFLHPNVAIEAQLGYQIISSDEPIYLASNRLNDLSFNLGIQTFLGQRRSEAFDLMDKYLRKGNFITSSQGYFRSDFENNTFNLLLNPQLSYFVSDRVVLGGNFRFNHNKSQNFRSTGISLGANGKVYLPVGERLFLTPKINIDAGIGISKANTFQLVHSGGTIIVLDSIVTGGGTIIVLDTLLNPLTLEESEVRNTSFGLSGDLALELNYFTQNNYLIFGGFRSQFQFNFDENLDLLNRSTILNLYTGIEYFFTENLSIRSVINFNLFDTARNGDDVNIFSNSSKHLGMNISLSYFIPRKEKN
ncbi:MAG: porin family protein [Bacteroidetes bacterium]|jgi:hypothetical protein|nr:porin family protein [Bacteroidota bacterium]MDF1864467.1 outer membrane beta-barrel protein [Saprospiraceae bacterium]